MTAPTLPPPGKELHTFVNRCAPTVQHGYRVVVWAILKTVQISWIDGDYPGLSAAKAAALEALKIVPGHMAVDVNDFLGRTVFSRVGENTPQAPAKVVAVTALVGLSGNGEQAHRRFKKSRPKPKSLLNPAHRKRKS